LILPSCKTNRLFIHDQSFISGLKANWDFKADIGSIISFEYNRKTLPQERNIVNVRNRNRDIRSFCDDNQSFPDRGVYRRTLVIQRCPVYKIRTINKTLRHGHSELDPILAYEYLRVLRDKAESIGQWDEGQIQGRDITHDHK
jgi:hypothetical protein